MREKNNGNDKRSVLLGRRSNIKGETREKIKEERDDGVPLANLLKVGEKVLGVAGVHNLS